jgi:hypothetical protein
MTKFPMACAQVSEKAIKEYKQKPNWNLKPDEISPSKTPLSTHTYKKTFTTNSRLP